jgi:hypothetical protein
MSNKFDSYDDNDEITLSSTSNSKAELKMENELLKNQLEAANKIITEYEEVISKNNVKSIGNSNLSEDDIFNITHNSTFIIANN